MAQLFFAKSKKARSRGTQGPGDHKGHVQGAILEQAACGSPTQRDKRNVRRRSSSPFTNLVTKACWTAAHRQLCRYGCGHGEEAEMYHVKATRGSRIAPAADTG